MGSYSRRDGRVTHAGGGGYLPVGRVLVVGGPVDHLQHSTCTCHTYCARRVAGQALVWSMNACPTLGVFLRVICMFVLKHTRHVEIHCFSV